MVRRFEMCWPDLSSVVCADLLDNENPELCEAFWRRLPFSTVMASSMSAGEMLKIPLTFVLPVVTDPGKLHFFPDTAPGTILSYPMCLLFKVGTVVEPFRIPRLAILQPEELLRFKPAAIRLREAYFFTKEVNIATIRKAR